MQRNFKGINRDVRMEVNKAKRRRGKEKGEEGKKG
jgi:hypothetical protein